MGQGVSVQDLISIIVPVYNTEKYLDQCIQSVLAQTYTNWELLLIDDGSTDSSGAICDKYAAEDSRIRVFHKINEGISTTRNYGISHILGEYVIHVDSDDWIEPEMLQDMHRAIRDSKADMVICDYYEEYHSTQTIRRIEQRPSDNDAQTVLMEMFQHLHGSCCNKLIRSRCYKEFDLQYPHDLNMGEDLYAMVTLLQHPIKITYLAQAYYHYIKDENENSLVQSTNLAILKERMRRFDNLTKNHPCHTICMSRMAFAIASYAFNRGNMSSKEYAHELSPYRQWITLKEPALYGYNIISRLRLFLSCKGLYRPMYWLFALKVFCMNLLKLIK